MSSTDHPEPGASSLKEHDSGSATSPQGGQPQIDHPEPTTSLSEKPAAIESDSTAVLSSQPQSDSTAAPDHPAGGERVAPVTATTSTTTTPANETTSAPVAQPTTKSPAMETEEPKLGVDSSEQEQSDEGKEDGGPSLDITLLLTTGSRHPFTIDGKYLRKRSVNVENYDPFAMSVYTLKELIWREWRSDWETRPSSPSSIRLISFGKLLDDKSPLSESKFNHDAPNVVHMTVKPQEVVDEEDAKGTKTQYGRERDNNEGSPGCRCVIL